DVRPVEVDAEGAAVDDVAVHGGVRQVEVAVALGGDVAVDRQAVADEVGTGGDADVARDDRVLQRARLPGGDQEVPGHRHAAGVPHAVGGQGSLRGTHDAEPGEHESPDDDA